MRQAVIIGAFRPVAALPWRQAAGCGRSTVGRGWRAQAWRQSYAAAPFGGGQVVGSVPYAAGTTWMSTVDPVAC